ACERRRPRIRAIVSCLIVAASSGASFAFLFPGMSRRQTNARVADLLRRYAAALSLEGADRFKLRAYRRAAETIEGLDGHVADLVKQESDLTELPGIGRAISEIIVEIVQSRKLGRLERTVAKLLPGMMELA